MIRTIDEVRARFNDPETRDLFGFAGEVLGVYLPEALKEGFAASPLTEEHVRKEAVSYLHFAFGKAIDHRGLSASRSIVKMREYAWLLGLDEAVAFSKDDNNYTNYGVPILKHMARALGVEIPPEINAWPDGGPCRPGCEEGCGQ